MAEFIPFPFKMNKENMETYFLFIGLLHRVWNCQFCKPIRVKIKAKCFILVVGSLPGIFHDKCLETSCEMKLFLFVIIQFMDLDENIDFHTIKFITIFWSFMPCQVISLLRKMFFKGNDRITKLIFLYCPNAMVIKVELFSRCLT